MRATGRTFEIRKNPVPASDLTYKFRKEITARSKFRLINYQTGEPLKIVDHIGCHYARIFPEKGIGATTDLCLFLSGGQVFAR